MEFNGDTVSGILKFIVEDNDGGPFTFKTPCSRRHLKPHCLQSSRLLPRRRLGNRHDRWRLAAQPLRQSLQQAGSIHYNRDDPQTTRCLSLRRLWH